MAENFYLIVASQAGKGQARHFVGRCHYWTTDTTMFLFSFFASTQNSQVNLSLFLAIER